MTDRLLVVDVGTSSVRAVVVDGDAHVVAEHRRPLLPDTPVPGLVEFDAAEMAACARQLATAALDEAGPVAAVGITNQRGSSIVWDRATGEPVAPGIGWQDLRTVGRCLELRADGVRGIAPNHSATKLEAILDQVDADRTRDLCVGTVDTWVAWNLTGGAAHVTDATNALVTALRTDDDVAWDRERLERMRIPETALPVVVDSSLPDGRATTLPGAPPLTGILGDQQASLLGQGCVRAGQAKITFGTGAMLDVIVAAQPSFNERGRAGTYPVVTRRIAGVDTWGVEAMVLSAGTAVEWLRDDLGILERTEDCEAVAASCDDTGDVWFVPALLGLGTPHWDFGARGALLGLTRGTGRPELVRAVLEGVAHRGADLVESAEADTDQRIDALRVDGGMVVNGLLVQLLADATQRSVEVAPVREATALGAAFCAGLAVGTWSGDEALAATWQPARTVEPGAPLDRDRWHAAVERAAAWHPELTAIEV